MLPFLADLPPSVFTVLAFIFGLAFGSFLNVVIYRLPLGQNPAWPASHCPACQMPLAWYDNIPLLSFILLRRRCRHCDAPIAWRYPAVELLTACVWAGLAWHYGAVWMLPWALGLALFIISLAFIDMEHQLLPDVLTFPMLLFAFAASVTRQLNSLSLTPNVTFDLFFTDPTADFVRWKAALYGALWLALAAPCMYFLGWIDGWLFDRYIVEEESDGTANSADTSHNEAIDAACAEQQARVLTVTFAVGLVLAVAWVLWLVLDRRASVQTQSYAYEGILNAVYGAFIAGGIIWLLRAAYFWLRQAEGMGLGDVKMMAGVGAYLGALSSFGVLLYGSIFGAAAGLLVALRGRDRWQTALPFGTCLAIAALLVLLQS